MASSDTLDPRLIALGRSLRQLRRERNLSQEALAVRAGVHPNHVGRIERGLKDVRVTTLLSLLAALEASPGEIGLPELGSEPIAHGAPPRLRAVARSHGSLMRRIDEAERLLRDLRTILETGD